MRPPGRRSQYITIFAVWRYPQSVPTPRGRSITDAYLSYRSGAVTHIEALFATDPDCGMAHVLGDHLLSLGSVWRH
jgi:hypothetical protein